MTEKICRFCGFHFCPSISTSSLDKEMIDKFESYFKITLYNEKELLPTFICSDCKNKFEECCNFLQRIVDVQERLKTNLLEELNNQIPSDEYEIFELKIERLDELPLNVIENLKYDKIEKIQVSARNRGIKMTRSSMKYTMEDLFKVNKLVF